VKVALVALLFLPALPAQARPLGRCAKTALLLWHQTELPKQSLHVRYQGMN